MLHQLKFRLSKRKTVVLTYTGDIEVESIKVIYDRSNFKDGKEPKSFWIPVPKESNG